MVVTPFLQKLGVVCPDLWLSLVQSDPFNSPEVPKAVVPGLGEYHEQETRGAGKGQG